MWKRHKVPVLFLLLRVICSNNGYCFAFDEETVTKMLQTSFDCHSNPALAVAVVKHGKILYSRGFGYTSLDKKNPVTDETLFGIASITKSFSAALFLKLLQKTNLTIQSKVQELLGDEFILYDTIRTDETTFLDMLSHKTAILSNRGVRMDKSLTRDTLLSRLRLLKSNKQFRVDFVYNNMVYGAVGRISEILGGHAQNNKRWEDLISEHLFEPLGMSKSTFATRVDYDREDLVTAYSEQDGPGILTAVTPELSRRWADLCASGSIISSVKDMTKWLNFHLSEGKNGSGHQMLDKKLVKSLHKPRVSIRSAKYLGIQSPQFPTTIMETGYALGLRVGHYRGIPLVAHTGGTWGYKSYMAMLPSHKVGVIVLMNGRDTNFRQRAPVAHYLLDSVLGLEPYVNHTTICSFPRPWASKKKESYRPERTNVSLDFMVEEYTGIYSDKAFGNVEIDHNSTLQSLVMLYGWGVWELLVWPTTAKKDSKEQRFFGKGVGPHMAPDMFPLYFIRHPKKNETIVGFKPSAFERSRPPIFCKKEHMEVCEEMKTKIYPEDEADSCTSSAMSMFHDKWTISVLMLLFFLNFIFIDKCMSLTLFRI